MKIKTREEMPHLKLWQYRQYVAAERTKYWNWQKSQHNQPVKEFDDSLGWAIA